MQSLNTASDSDQKYLRRAIELAQKSFGLASPNPNVGAVLVDSGGEVVGEGFHTYDGKKHAEVLAVEQAGEKARGSTLYINLEPCCHRGRTAPCTDALISAGIKRVVACMADPNPVISGRGFAKLRQAGGRNAEKLLGGVIDVAEPVLRIEQHHRHRQRAHDLGVKKPDPIGAGEVLVPCLVVVPGGVAEGAQYAFEVVGILQTNVLLDQFDASQVSGFWN